MGSLGDGGAVTGAAPAEQPVADGFRHTRWFLVAFCALAAAWGIRNIWFWEPSRLDLLVPIALAICLGCWAVEDARRLRHPLPVLARPWFFLLAVVVVPGYVIWSRRWRGVGWVALHTALWYALATAVMHGGGVLVFGNEWLRALGV